MNMNVNMNNNGRRKRDSNGKESVLNHFFEQNEQLEYLLQNIDLEDYCDSQLNIKKFESKASCLEDIVERTIITSFSHMHNNYFQENSFCNSYSNDDNFIEQIIENVLKN